MGNTESTVDDSAKTERGPSWTESPASGGSPASDFDRLEAAQDQFDGLPRSADTQSSIPLNQALDIQLNDHPDFPDGLPRYKSERPGSPTVARPSSDATIKAPPPESTSSLRRSYANGKYGGHKVELGTPLNTQGQPSMAHDSDNLLRQIIATSSLGALNEPSIPLDRQSQSSGSAGEGVEHGAKKDKKHKRKRKASQAEQLLSPSVTSWSPEPEHGAHGSQGETLKVESRAATAEPPRGKRGRTPKERGEKSRKRVKLSQPDDGNLSESVSPGLPSGDAEVKPDPHQAEVAHGTQEATPQPDFQEEPAEFEGFSSSGRTTQDRDDHIHDPTNHSTLDEPERPSTEMKAGSESDSDAQSEEESDSAHLESAEGDASSDVDTSGAEAVRARAPSPMDQVSSDSSEDDNGRLGRESSAIVYESRNRGGQNKKRRQMIQAHRNARIRDNASMPPVVSDIMPAPPSSQPRRQDSDTDDSSSSSSSDSSDDVDAEDHVMDSGSHALLEEQDSVEADSPPPQSEDESQHSTSSSDSSHDGEEEGGLQPNIQAMSFDFETENFDDVEHHENDETLSLPTIHRPRSPSPSSDSAMSEEVAMFQSSPPRKVRSKIDQYFPSSDRNRTLVVDNSEIEEATRVQKNASLATKKIDDSRRRGPEKESDDEFNAYSTAAHLGSQKAKAASSGRRVSKPSYFEREEEEVARLHAQPSSAQVGDEEVADRPTKELNRTPVSNMVSSSGRKHGRLPKVTPGSGPKPRRAVQATPASRGPSSSQRVKNNSTSQVTPRGRTNMSSQSTVRATSGTPSARQINAVKVLDAFNKYCEDTNTPEAKAKSQLHEDPRRHINLWDYLAEASPNQDKRGLTQYCRRHLGSYGTTAFTEDDDRKICHLVGEYGRKWTNIAALMNRNPGEVQKRWENYLICGVGNKKDRWTEDESEEFIRVMVETLQEIQKDQVEDIWLILQATEEGFHDWQSICLRLGNRGILQCREKWKDIRRRCDAVQLEGKLVQFETGTASQATSRPSPAIKSTKKTPRASKTLKMDTHDKYLLIRAIRRSRAKSDADIPWRDLVSPDFRSRYRKETRQLAWDRLKRFVSGWADLSIREICDELLPRFREDDESGGSPDADPDVEGETTLVDTPSRPTRPRTPKILTPRRYPLSSAVAIDSSSDEPDAPGQEAEEAEEAIESAGESQVVPASPATTRKSKRHDRPASPASSTGVVFDSLENHNQPLPDEHDDGSSDLGAPVASQAVFPDSPELGTQKAPVRRAKPPARPAISSSFSIDIPAAKTTSVTGMRSISRNRSLEESSPGVHPSTVGDRWKRKRVTFNEEASPLQKRSKRTWDDIEDGSGGDSGGRRRRVERGKDVNMEDIPAKASKSKVRRTQ